MHDESTPSKRCSRCQEVKTLTLFYPRRNRRSGRASHCIECAKALARQYYEDNKPHALAVARQYRAENSERLSREAAARNKVNRERHYASVKRWYQRPKGRQFSIAKEGRRRAQKRATQVEQVDFAAILERDGLICHICGGSVARDDVHFDHVIPLVRGGPHTEDNIHVAHSTCNSRKGAKLLISEKEVF
jgi:5-methylcytosine-specific restriction endonuclease McrA